MWRLEIFLLALAFISGGLWLTSQSAVSAGVAAMLFLAFVGLCALVLVIDGRQSRWVA